VNIKVVIPLFPASGLVPGESFLRLAASIVLNEGRTVMVRLKASTFPDSDLAVISRV